MTRPNNFQARLLLWAFVCFIACSTFHFVKGQTSTNNNVAPEVAYVASGMQNARSSFRCGSALIQYEETLSPAFANVLAAELPSSSVSLNSGGRESARWYMSGTRLSVTAVVESQDKKNNHIFRLVRSDNTVRTLYQLGRGKTVVAQSDAIQSDGEVITDKASMFDGMWRDFIHLDPRSYITHGGAPLTIDISNQFLKFPTRFLGMEEVFGAICYKIELNRSEIDRSIYWVDAQHGFLIRKQETFNDVNGKSSLDSRTIVPTLISSGKHWLPAKLEVNVYDDSEDGAKNLQSTKNINISGFSADCNIPEEVFQLDWPLNTFVKDRISNRKFVVAASLPNDLPRAEDDPNNQIGLAQPTVKVGQAAPDFSAVDMNGKTWKLSDLRGRKNLLLTFFPKCFTGGCANHLSSLRDKQKEFDALDTQILAVSVDPAEGEKGQKAFAAQWKLDFPLIPDTSRALSKLFGAAQNEKQLSARMSLFIDKTGVVRWIDTDVHVDTHGSDVLAIIRKLGLNP